MDCAFKKILFKSQSKNTVKPIWSHITKLAANLLTSQINTLIFLYEHKHTGSCSLAGSGKIVYIILDGHREFCFYLLLDALSVRDPKNVCSIFIYEKNKF